eukprot:scaffold225_cov388-Prasinococcus_capsulatus_cf.AAC.22
MDEYRAEGDVFVDVSTQASAPRVLALPKSPEPKQGYHIIMTMLQTCHMYPEHTLRFKLTTIE